MEKSEEKTFVNDIKQIVSTAKFQSYKAVNLMQVASNWLVGKRIVEQEQKGAAKAEYGKYVIRLASETLTQEFGKGYSETNVKSFRKFYMMFDKILIQKTPSANLPIGQTLSAQFNSIELLKHINQIKQALPAELCWSHYERLMRVEDDTARLWYMQEAASQQWSFRTLDRNISSQYYYRLLQTPDALKPNVVDEMKTITADYQKDKYNFIKNARK